MAFPIFASFDLVPYTAILLSDLPVDAVMGEPDCNCCVPVFTEGVNG